MEFRKWLTVFRKTPVPEWRRHPNPYLQLHLKVYPKYLKEVDKGTYDPAKDPFCSSDYILSHSFKNFKDVERELNNIKSG